MSSELEEFTWDDDARYYLYDWWKTMPGLDGHDQKNLTNGAFTDSAQGMGASNRTPFAFQGGTLVMSRSVARDNYRKYLATLKDCHEKLSKSQLSMTDDEQAKMVGFGVYAIEEMSIILTDALKQGSPRASPGSSGGSSEEELKARAVKMKEWCKKPTRGSLSEELMKQWEISGFQTARFSFVKRGTLMEIVFHHSSLFKFGEKHYAFLLDCEKELRGRSDKIGKDVVAELLAKAYAEVDLECLEWEWDGEKRIPRTFGDSSTPGDKSTVLSEKMMLRNVTKHTETKKRASRATSVASKTSTSNTKPRATSVASQASSGFWNNNSGSSLDLGTPSPEPQSPSAAGSARTSKHSASPHRSPGAGEKHRLSSVSSAGSGQGSRASSGRKSSSLSPFVEDGAPASSSYLTVPPVHTKSSSKDSSRKSSAPSSRITNPSSAPPKQKHGRHSKKSKKKEEDD